MKFVIPCRTFVRLSATALQINENDEQGRTFLRSVRLEMLNGRLIAVATNAKVMAIELISDDNEEPDGGVSLTIDPTLIAVATVEQEFESNLEILWEPSTGYAVVMTTQGYIHPGSGHVAGEYADWRKIVPKNAEKSVGVMVFNGAAIARLTKTSPTGEIVFPRYIDATAPIVIRDREEPTWFGLFLSNSSKERSGGVGFWATVPDWVKPENGSPVLDETK